MASLEREAQRSRAKKDANAFAQRVAQRGQEHGQREHVGGARGAAAGPRKRQSNQGVFATRRIAMTAMFAAVASVMMTLYQVRDTSQAMASVKASILSHATATDESLSSLSKQAGKANDMIMALDRKNTEITNTLIAVQSTAARLDGEVTQLKAAQAKMVVASTTTSAAAAGTTTMQTMPSHKDAHRARVRALQHAATAYAMGGNCAAMRDALAQLRAIDPGNNLFKARGNSIVRECSALEAFRHGTRLPTPQRYRQ